MKVISNFSIVIAAILAVGSAKDRTRDYSVVDVSEAKEVVLAAEEVRHQEVIGKVLNVKLGQIVPRHLCHRAIRNSKVLMNRLKISPSLMLKIIPYQVLGTGLIYCVIKSRNAKFHPFADNLISNSDHQTLV